MIASLVLAAALGQPLATPVVSPAAVAPEAAPAPLGRSGAFGAGVVLEPLALGSTQAISRGGASAGVDLLGAALVDLGARWALRVQLDLAAGGSGGGGYAMVGLTPGVVHRWRTEPGQRWVPYAGAGLRLGAAGADRPLLGAPLVASTLGPLTSGATGGPAPRDWHHSSSSDPNFASRAGAFPEAWAGVAWHPRTWLALDLGVAYTWVRLLGEDLHVLHERVGVRLEL